MTVMPIADRTACSTIGLKPTQDIFVFVYIQHSKKIAEFE